MARRRMRRNVLLAVASLLIGSVVALEVGTALAANSSGPAATASKAKRGPRGPRGFRGPQGPQGPQGPPGPAASSGTGGTSAGLKIAYRANLGTGVQVLFNSHGMKIEANCSTSFSLYFRSSGGGELVSAFSFDILGSQVFAEAVETTAANQAIELNPGGGIDTGQLVYSGTDGSVLTMSYMSYYGSTQGDCVMVGNVQQAA